MGSKKIKNKKSKEKSLDDRFNMVFRKLCLVMLENILIELTIDYDEPLVEDVLNYMRNVYYDIPKEYCDGLVDDIYFIELLNYTQEIIILAYSPRKNLLEELTFFRKKFVKKLRSNDVKLELLVYASKVGSLYENQHIYPKEISSLYSEIGKKITDVLFIFEEYISTYSYGFKNYEISKFEFNEDEKIIAKYSKSPMLLREQIEYLDKLLNDMKRLEGDIKGAEYISKITENIHLAYANFISRDIDDEYFEDFKGNINSEKYYNFPFFKNRVYELESFVLSKEDIAKIPDERLYAIPKYGVRFDFVNSEKCIDHIDMKETKDKILFNIYIKNNGGLFTSQADPGDIKESFPMDSLEDIYIKIKKKTITSKIVRISCYLNKEKLKNSHDFKSKLNSMRIIEYIPSKDKFTFDFFNAITYSLFACTYIAFYNPNLLSDEVKLYNKTSNKENGYHRKSCYRVAYIKKLPVNAKASSEALKKGRENGFLIPDGYTFVSESNPNILEKKQKNIKIK